MAAIQAIRSHETWAATMFPSGVIDISNYNRGISRTIQCGGFPLGPSSPQEVILIFRGTHQVMAAEKRLKKGGVAMRLIPVPRRLTSDCGLAIRIPAGERSRAREILAGAKLLPVSVHILRDRGEYEPFSL